jgi:GTP-binding protein
MVDMSYVGGGNPNDNFTKLNKELELYSSRLSHKPQIVVANKMDTPGAGELIKKFRPEKAKEVYKISALTGEGIGKLLRAIVSELKNLII